MQNEQCKPGGLGAPNLPSCRAPGRWRRGVCHPAGLRQTDLEHKPLLLLQHRLHSWTCSISAGLTTSSQNMRVCAQNHAVHCDRYPHPCYCPQEEIKTLRKAAGSTGNTLVTIQRYGGRGTWTSIEQNIPMLSASQTALV